MTQRGTTVKRLTFPYARSASEVALIPYIEPLGGFSRRAAWPELRGFAAAL